MELEPIIEYRDYQAYIQGLKKLIKLSWLLRRS